MIRVETEKRITAGRGGGIKADKGSGDEEDEEEDEEDEEEDKEERTLSWQSRTTK